MHERRHHLKRGNYRSLLPLATMVDKWTEEKCGLDSKCRHNMNGSNHDSSTTKTVTAQGVVATVKWFGVKRGYGFVPRSDTREKNFFNRTEIAHSKHRVTMRSICTGKTVVFGIACADGSRKATNVYRIDADLNINTSNFAIKCSSSNRQRTSSFEPRHRHCGKRQQVGFDRGAHLEVVFSWIATVPPQQHVSIRHGRGRSRPAGRENPSR